MKLKTPINENYAATIVEIKSTIKLDNCDNVVHTNIFGNLVIVGKETKAGEKGIFFPVETKLSPEFLHANNLYRDNTLNYNVDEKGYFEENGRIKCMRFRTHKSEGIFLPISSLLFISSVNELATLNVGDTFDEINGVKICEKYVPKISNTPGAPGSKKDRAVAKKVSRIVEGQFRFHTDTAQLGKNIHKIKPDSLISITNKLHGSSFVVSKIPVLKKLGWFLRLLKWMGVPIIHKEYDIIYSSRKVIKNDDLNKDYTHYYKEDIWKDVADELSPFMTEGLTLYGEVVGFTPSGQAIQKGYDYGCNVGVILNRDGSKNIGVAQPYIYRITFTNLIGKVFEFSAKQVQDWCKLNGLKAVPQYFYGYASEIIPYIGMKVSETSTVWDIEKWQNDFLAKLQTMYNMEKDCELCENKVPAEGLVVRIEGLECDAYKLKSFKFREHETKELDKGEVDMETAESQATE